MNHSGGCAALTALLVLTTAAGLSAQEPAKPEVLVGSATDERSTWDGQQVLSATPKGEVLLLRSDSLTAISLTTRKRHRLVRDRKPSAGEEGPFVRAAEVGSDPASWVVLDLGTVRLFENGAELPVADPGWMPHWVTMAGGDPVAVVLPYRKKMQVGEMIERFPLRRG